MLNKCKFHSNNFTKTQAAATEVKNYVIKSKDEFVNEEIMNSIMLTATLI